MSSELAIMFDDLSENIQQDLLEHHRITDPKDMNWDIIPITVIPLPD